jgi:hypothetical protein
MASTPVVAQTRVLPLARVRRERALTTRGQVLVAMGARVGALDIVARADTLGHMMPVPLARYLRVPELSLAKYMRKQPGDEIQSRDIIASKPELFGTLQRIYRAPGAGRIAALNGSWLVLDLVETPVELKALYRGSVVNVMPQRGIVIEAIGAIVQGLWGSGGEGYGVLKKMVDSPGAVLSEDKIDVVSRGAIVLAGAGVTEESIRRAAHERVSGLIVGGLAPRLRELVGSLMLPTLVTDGFGECPMSAPIWELLASHDGEEASISTFSGVNRHAAGRPEVFIPIMAPGGSGGALPPPVLMAEAGARVRVIVGSCSAGLGKIVEAGNAPRVLESGISAWGAEVELSTGERIFVPWENLELID